MNQTAVKAAPAGEAVAPRYFLYGSCVSRDTFDFLPEPKKLLRYVARQSLISAGNMATGLGETLPHFASPFQERTSQEDAQGGAYAALAAAAPNIDLLVLDLVDERGGVYALGDAVFLTRSVERVGTNTDDVLGAESIVTFGGPEHLALWLPAWERLWVLLGELGLQDRTVVLAVPWATLSISESRPPASFGLTPEEGNAAFEPYYDAVRESGAPLVRPRWWATRVRADADHKWGLAPFHYAREVYVDLADQLIRRAARMTASATRGL